MRGLRFPSFLLKPTTIPFAFLLTAVMVYGAGHVLAQCQAMGVAGHNMADMQPIPPPEQLPVPL